MNKKGFTLVELLVVMVIIALLSAIIFPVMTSVREKTERSTCMQNMKQIGAAVAMYYSDNKKYPEALAPDVAYDTNGDVIPMNELNGNLLASDYLQSPKILHCPTDSRFEEMNEVAVVSYDENNVSFTKEIYAYSSYEKYINDETIVDSNGKYTDPTIKLQYNTNWWKANVGETTDDNYARQLKWKNPPSDTVICWCMNHAEYPYSDDQDNYKTTGQALVLFLDGHVSLFNNVTTVASETWKIKPN